MNRMKRLTAVAVMLAGLLSGGAMPEARAAYPDKPVKIIVGFPAGQATDAVARVVAERLTKALGQTFIVENRPGQGGSLGLAQLAKAKPDGYEMMLSATASLVTNPHLYKSVGYDSLKDFEPVATLVDLPLVLVANPQVPFDDFKGFVDYAHAHPGKLNFSSSGNGTLSHLAMELLSRSDNLSMMHVPYKGSPRAMADLVAGNVSIGFDTIAVTKPLIDAKRLKLLAVATPERLALFPDTPTIQEEGVADFVASAWLGMVFPAGTPAEPVQVISGQLQKIIGEPDVQKTLLSMGALPRYAGPAEFAQLLHSDYKKWGEIVTLSGARVD